MRKADVKTLADELFAVQHVLDSEISLRRAFTDPSSSPAARAGLARQLFGAQIGERPLGVVTDLVSAAVGRARATSSTRVEQLAVQALYSVAAADGTLDNVEDELFRFGRIVDREPALLLALTDPAVPSTSGSPSSTACSRARRPRRPLRLVHELVASPRGRRSGSTSTSTSASLPSGATSWSPR